MNSTVLIKQIGIVETFPTPGTGHACPLRRTGGGPGGARRTRLLRCHGPGEPAPE
ncbi:hypothetical protein FTUN_2415 [Frigoriglobus tundricola]|uniref:Uncharacterized protein n=1 Tax=Frigoriglobus tundricola TaxID=2774151 RepID=A0A6M5YLB4_9BACT|nr:hypothetical protein FTUN_2415 [Frigoriglobus tundricola]